MRTGWFRLDRHDTLGYSMAPVVPYLTVVPVDLDPGTPLWWLQRLDGKLQERRKKIRVYDDYYEGRHNLAFASEKFRKAFGGLFEEFADNWCDLVVDAVEERLNVEGFRFGRDLPADEAAWRIWQANQLDAHSQMGHTEALICGEAAVIVQPGADEATPDVTVESPEQVIVANAPSSIRQRRAALKRWCDDDGTEMATVYLPDGIYKYRQRRKGELGPSLIGTAEQRSRWIARPTRETGDSTWPLRNPLLVVPVVPLCNRPRLLKPPVSEIRKVIPIQQGVNKLVADMLVASEFAAFRQRWATGIDIPEDPETHEPIEPFKAAIDRLWTNEDQEGKFGEFSETDLQNFVGAIELLVQHIASQTRTPPHYFYLKGELPSGETIKSAETGLVAKARRKMRHFGETWEEAMRLALRLAGEQEKASTVAAETIWGDPESRTEGEHIDAVMKRKALGVPWRQLMEDAGYTPTQIERMEQMLAQDAQRAATALGALVPGEPEPEPEPAPAPPAAG